MLCAIANSTVDTVSTASSHILEIIPDPRDPCRSCQVVPGCQLEVKGHKLLKVKEAIGGLDPVVFGTLLVGFFCSSWVGLGRSCQFWGSR